MKRDDLRVAVSVDHPLDQATATYTGFREVSDAELAELGYVKGDSFEQLAEAVGYVKRPVCRKCAGHGTLTDSGASESEWLEGLREGDCPSCGGSGFGRLVALGDVCLSHGAVRIGANLEQCEYHGPMQIVVPCRFAALEGEDTP